MAQLAAIENLLFYATPIDEIEKFAKNLSLNRERYRCFDPCIGEGTAVNAVVHALGDGRGEIIGVEIAEERAAAARLVSINTVHAAIEEVQFHNYPNLIWMNPPYDEANGKRVELDWINRMASIMNSGTMMILVLPDRFFKGGPSHNDLRMCLYRSGLQLVRKNQNSYSYGRENLLGGIRFSDAHYDEFKQVFLIVEKSDYHIELAKEIPISGINGKFKFSCQLSNGYGSDYDWARSTNKFDVSKVPPVEYKSVLDDSKFFDLFGPISENVTVDPLMPMRTEIVAAVIAGGMFSGVKIDDEVVRGGITYRNEEHTIEEGDSKETITTQVMVANLSVVDMKTGDIAIYDSDSPEFGPRIEKVARVLSKKLEVENPSRFDSIADMAKYPPTFADVHAPRAIQGVQNGLLSPQIEKASIILRNWERRKSTILIGEMGVGKTCTSIAATVAKVRNKKADAQKIVILIPSKNDLRKKWAEEIATSCRDIPHKIFDVETITDVQEAFANDGITFVIIKESMAKRTSGWAHVGKMRSSTTPEEMRLDRIVKLEKHMKKLQTSKTALSERHQDTLQRFLEEYKYLTSKSFSQELVEGKCHKCGAKVDFVNSEDEIPEKDNEILYCPECKEKQWTVQRDRNDNAYASIARFINKKYAGNYVLILDEAHNLRGATSARGLASHQLIRGSKRCLSMTGTIYTGYASSLFHTLYRCQSTFRTSWGYDSVLDFVRNYGLEKTIVKLKKRSNSSSWSGYNLSSSQKRTEEIPGIHPSMIAMMLPYTVFMKLDEFAVFIPKQSGETLFVDVPTEVVKSVDAYLSKIKDHAVQEMQDRDNKNMSLMGQFQWANRGVHDTYPEGDHVESSVSGLYELAKINEGKLAPKEEAIIRLVLEEKKMGRPVLLFHLQTERRPWQHRLYALFEKYGLRLVYMPSTVSSRVEFIENALKDGVDAVICNPNLVREGIDLLMFKMIIWVSVTDDAILVNQANARNHRIGQDVETRVVYLGYNKTYQSDRWTSTAKKVAAMSAIHGDVQQGLAALLGDRNLIAQVQETMIKFDKAASDLHVDDLPPLYVWNEVKEPKLSVAKSILTPVVEVPQIDWAAMAQENLAAVQLGMF